MSEGKGQIIIAHAHNSTTMGINSKSCCPVGNVSSTGNTCISHALTEEKICQSYEMLKLINITQNDQTTNESVNGGESYLPWRRFEPSDVQLDFHRPCARFNGIITESAVSNFSSTGRTCLTKDTDHDSMKCLNSCCYRLPTLPEGVSVGGTEILLHNSNTTLPISRVPSSPDVLVTDVLPPPWKNVETIPAEPSNAGQHVATLSSRTQSEQNSGPLYMNDSTCHCTWTGTGAAHYRGSRRNSLVPTATGSSRRRCSQVPAVERVSIFDEDHDEVLMQQGRAERSWSWLLDSPMTAEEDEERTRRGSFHIDMDAVSTPVDHPDGGKSFGGFTAVDDTSSCLVTGQSDPDTCLLPTAIQLLLTRSHSACELHCSVERDVSSWPCGEHLRKYASVPNLAFI